MFFCRADQACIAVFQLRLLAFVAHEVRRVCMETLDFSGSGQAEAFFCAGMRFHLWHKRNFSERKYINLFLKRQKIIFLYPDTDGFAVKGLIRREAPRLCKKVFAACGGEILF
jgi:hypothetical protein